MLKKEVLRIVLYGIGITSLASLVYFAGPLVEIGGYRPLEIYMVREILILLLVTGAASFGAFHFYKRKKSSAQIEQGISGADQDPSDADVLKEELSLLGLSLRSEIAHRRARLVEALQPLEVEGRRVIVFSQRDRPAVGDQQLQNVTAWVRVGARTWVAWIDGEEREIDASSPYELRGLLDELLLLC